ncbi:relaxase/mobilization nuclease domain-containing protein [Clostridioides sp. ZZV14-6009]|uniref:relaxase/mobilization nuclease domain-containing protein n=1 Tax=Clostridioides sp. ZZV14-6009 TaxID=2811487 RepID=UPI001D10E6E9|nr:relaxase/mobilization nuclease domain-containing protein [Clostridioides sp. ZZV14-6009]
MSYTELGNGDMRKHHIKHDTNRILAEMGDMGSREAITSYAEAVLKQHTKRKIGGYEVRVSFGLDELKPENPQDVQQAMGVIYLICKQLAPHSPCWVTMHGDGEGGCLHGHVMVVNQDVTTDHAVSHGLSHHHVACVADKICIENGLSTIGKPAFVKKPMLWQEVRDSESYYGRTLGDTILRIRNQSQSLEEFEEKLNAEGITLQETVKADKQSGEIHKGWTYHTKKGFAGERRSRRRAGKKLADDLKKGSIEQYFTEKQAEQKEVHTEIEPVLNKEMEKNTMNLNMIDITKKANRDNDSFLQSFILSDDDVIPMLDSLEVAHRSHGNPINRKRIMQIKDNPKDYIAMLQSDVDASRKEYIASKEYRDVLRKQETPSFYALQQIFKHSQSKAKNPVDRMINDMFAQMFAFLLIDVMTEHKQVQLNDAEEQLYESRKAMWDSEKRLKSAQKAIHNNTIISQGKGRNVSADMESVYEDYKQTMDKNLEID